MSDLREYQVTLPITGLAYLTVEAESAEQAIEQAMEIVTHDDVHEWEAVHSIMEGNVCHAMQPWDAVAKDCGPVDEALPA